MCGECGLCVIYVQCVVYVQSLCVVFVCFVMCVIYICGGMPYMHDGMEWKWCRYGL